MTAKKLQVIENGVYRKMLGAPKYAPNCTLRGEVGASLMATRVMSGRLQYIRSIMQGSNEMMKEVIREMMHDDKNKWMKATKVYLDKVGLEMNQATNMTKEELKKHMKQWDSSQWRKEVQSKATLTTYYAWKEDLEEQFLDNHPSLIVFYKARSNCLSLKDKNRHTGEDTTCSLCKQDCEDIKHLVLSCPVYGTERASSIHLQRPYNENEDNTIGRFLFDKEDIESKKELLYRIWQKRKAEMKKCDLAGNP